MDSQELKLLRQKFEQAVKVRRISKDTAKRYQRTIRAYLVFLKENGAGQLTETNAAKFLHSERASVSRLEQSFYALKFLFVHVLRQKFKLRFNEIAQIKVAAPSPIIGKIKRLLDMIK